MLSVDFFLFSNLDKAIYCVSVCCFSPFRTIDRHYLFHALNVCTYYKVRLHYIGMYVIVSIDLNTLIRTDFVRDFDADGRPSTKCVAVDVP